MELLSPAGNGEALKAAVQNGADAVYLGYTSFGARSYAGNFNQEELKAAIRYCHERGRRVYVTVNTLVKDAEMDDAADVLELLCALDADAAIVQDLGLARLCRERFPDLALHASTQMTIHNAQGVSLLQELGFTRVVPARECPLDEIRKIASQGLETEVFVHGALCVSVSGQCLMSSMLGGRSGNRGRCAQPCRMPYRQADGTQGYLLSTRDRMLRGRRPELRDAGVHSLKIEGRMKRPEYVAVVTAAYRKALDCALRGEPYAPDERTVQALLQIFNRGGFTEGYLMGKNNAALMSFKRPNHAGVRIGTVTGARGALCTVRLEKALQDGDALAVRGRQELETTYAGPGARVGAEATVRIAGAGGAAGSPCPGDGVYRLTDARQMDAARQSYAAERVRIPFRAHLRATVGVPPELSVTDGTFTARAAGSLPVAAAQNKPLDAEGARRQIEKTGDTPYVLSGFEMQGEGAFLPVSTLNALRRDALAALAGLRCERRSARVLPERPLTERKEGERLLIAQTAHLSWADQLLKAGAGWIYWLPDDMRPAQMAEELAAADKAALKRVCVVMPQVAWTDELRALHGFVRQNAAQLGGVALNNPAQLALDWGLPRVADGGMNAFNARTAAFLFERGCERVTISPELNLGEIRDLLRLGGGFELCAYGRTQLMLLSHCTDCVKRGEEQTDAECGRCAAGAGAQAQPLIDRKGFVFPLRRLRLPHGCMLRLYNSVPMDASRLMDKVRTLPVSLRLQFTYEDAALCADITQHYRALMDGRPTSFACPGETTAGHLKRGAI